MRALVAQRVLDRRRDDLGDALEDASLIVGIGAAAIVVGGERAVDQVVDAQRADQHFDDAAGRARRQAVAAPRRHAGRQRRDQRAAVLEHPRHRALHELAGDRRRRIGRLACAHPAAGRPRRLDVVQEQRARREGHQPAERARAAAAIASVTVERRRRAPATDRRGRRPRAARARCGRPGSGDGDRSAALPRIVDSAPRTGGSSASMAMTAAAVPGSAPTRSGSRARPASSRETVQRPLRRHARARGAACRSDRRAR